MFRMTVVGVKDVNAAFGDILRAFRPPQTAALMLPGAEVIAEEARNNVLDNDLVQSGDLYEGIKAVKVNQYAAGVRVDVPYGAVHEFGLENQVITERQRAFFWAMHAETGEDMWKALALSYSYTIPARPYLRPAIDTTKRAAVEAIMREAGAMLTRIAMRHGGGRA